MLIIFCSHFTHFITVLVMHFIKEKNEVDKNSIVDMQAYLKNVIWEFYFKFISERNIVLFG